MPVTALHDQLYMHTSLHALYLAFNFTSAVGIVLVNKIVFSHMNFPFSTALTLLHYILNIVGLEALAILGAYERRSARFTPHLIVLAVVVGVAPAINNLSLKLNDVGFYTTCKLLVTPCIVVLEWFLYEYGLSRMRALGLAGVCLGVAIASIHDLSLNLNGALASLVWVPIAATYKVLWSRVAKGGADDGGAWHTLALMRAILPWSAVVIACLVPVIDPPGLSEYEWSLETVGLLVVSSIAAFFVNWSGFLVMGACSALTHTILGQLKACIAILGGWCAKVLLLQYYTPKSVLGAALALVSMVFYTHFNLQESSLEHKVNTLVNEVCPSALNSEANGLQASEAEAHMLLPTSKKGKAAQA